MIMDTVMIMITVMIMAAVVIMVRVMVMVTVMVMVAVMILATRTRAIEAWIGALVLAIYNFPVIVWDFGEAPGGS